MHTLSRIYVLFSLLVLIMAVAVAGCAEGEDVQEDIDIEGTAPMQSAEGQPLLQVAGETESLSMFAEYAERVGLASELAQGGPYTVFAPANEAFENLQEATLSSLAEEDNDPLLRSILRNHIVEDEVLSADVSDTTAVLTLTGETLLIDRTNNTLEVGGEEVLQPDIQAENGVIHIIGGVLLPSDRSMSTEEQ